MHKMIQIGTGNNRLLYLPLFILMLTLQTCAEFEGFGQNQKSGGVRKTEINDRGTCLHLCDRDENCAGIDWAHQERHCWHHGRSSGCRNLISNDCCTHYSKLSISCYDNSRFIKTESSRKTGASPMWEIDNEEDCVKRCQDDGDCGGADWATKRKHCWHHTISTECSSPLESNGCCTHFEKKSIPCVSSNKFTKTLKKHMNGGVLMEDITEEFPCLVRCDQDPECGGVDWAVQEKHCWFLMNSYSCGMVRDNKRCTHYSKKAFSCVDNPRFTMSENRRKVGAVRMDQISDEVQCVDTCDRNDECGGVDWSEDEKHCWHHVGTSACKALVNNNCCRHFKKDTFNCDGNFIVRADRHKNGGVRMQADDEAGCVENCRTSSSCGAVDWAQDGKCYHFDTATACREPLRQLNGVTHYSKISIDCPN